MNLIVLCSWKPAISPGKIPNTIVNAIKQGNSQELAKFFNSNVELAIFDREDVYSKLQAELIIKNFFVKHPPNNFVLVHEGGKENAKYAIGNLFTIKDNFRVYFLLKISHKDYYIHQLRIEREEG